MNDKFFALPEDKQQRIINAGFKVFSRNTYKKSPASEIAAEAGISKALLFHYFGSKKGLYLFLVEKSAQITKQAMLNDGCYEPENLFEAMRLGLKSKIEIMRRFPDVGLFALKAYSETDPEVSSELSVLMDKGSPTQNPANAKWFNPDHYVEGLDLRMMYREMYLTAEGYLWEKMQFGTIDADEMERDFEKFIGFWESIYLKKERK